MGVKKRMDSRHVTVGGVGGRLPCTAPPAASLRRPAGHEAAPAIAVNPTSSAFACRRELRRVRCERRLQAFWSVLQTCTTDTDYTDMSDQRGVRTDSVRPFFPQNIFCFLYPHPRRLTNGCPCRVHIHTRRPSGVATRFLSAERRTKPAGSYSSGVARGGFVGILERAEAATSHLQFQEFNSSSSGA